MVTGGEQIVVGDTEAGGDVAYEVLCRRHHTLHLTAAAAGAVTPSPDTLLNSAGTHDGTDTGTPRAAT